MSNTVEQEHPLRQVRIIPGAVSANTHVALIVYPAHLAQHDLSIDVRATTGSTYSVTRSDATSDQEVHKWLRSFHPPLCVERLEVKDLPTGVFLQWWVTASGGGSRKLAQFRTLAPSEKSDPGSVRLVVASCYYDDALFGAQARAYGDTLKCIPQPVDLKLLVGDNLYLDVAPDQRSIWGGWRETAHRYRHYFWESDAYADALSQHANLATWDDHEFWNNYPEKQFWLDRTKDKWRPDYDAAGQAFLETFQNNLNRLPGCTDKRSHVYSTPACELFLADTRSRRTSMNKLRPKMFEDREFGDLLRWLGELEVPGLLVLGQPLWHSRGSFLDYAPIDFEVQFGQLWAALAECKADVLVVSGDVHHSRVLQVDMGNGRMLHEFVSSPAVHIPNEWSTLWQSYSSQGQGKVSYPKQLTVPSSGHTAGLNWIKPRVAECLASTNVQNTVGELVLRRIPQAKGALLVVDAGFWDTLNHRRTVSCSFVLRSRGDRK